jgi:hypothetical protein
MSIKKLGLTLVAVLALAGITASSAFATAEAKSGHWVVSGSTITEPKTVNCAKATGAANFKLAGKVLGSEVELEATGVECVESTIFNSEGFARDSGKLRFTGVSVVKPVGCSTNATLTTNALSTQVYMENTTSYDRFAPTSGTTFVNVPLLGCAAAGTYPVKGTDFGRSPNATGVESAHQKLEFSGAINTTAGGGLTLGTEAATLSGEAENTLSPEASFAAHE